MHDAGGLRRDAAGALRLRRRARVRRRDPRRPGSVPAPAQADLLRDARGDDLRARRRRRDPRVEALDRRRVLHASSRPSSGRSSSCSRSRASSSSARAPPERDDAARGRSRYGARADLARLPAARHRHGARLHRGARRGAVRLGHPLAASRRARRGCRAGRVSPCSGCCRPPGSTCSSRTRPQRSRASRIPANDPSGATYNLTQSITAVGAGGLRGRGVRVRRRRGSTISPSTRRTSRSPRSPRSAGSSARRSCCCSTCWSSGGACKIVASARDLYCAVVAGGDRRSCSCSRCS